MDSSNRYESEKFRAFITGALVGAGAALLFAPQAASKLRNRLHEYAIRAKEELDEAAERGVDILDNTMEAGHEFEKGKESFQQVHGKAKEFAEAGRNAVNESKKELASSNR